MKKLVFQTFIVFILLSVLPACSSSKYQILNKVNVSYFVVVSKSIATDRAELTDISHEICSGKNVCAIFFWVDRNRAGRNLDITDEQFKAIIAKYNFNSNSGIDKLMLCNFDTCN